jgi:RsiW-degrading membrane proteinase PrsW (M82 family)
MDEFTGLAQQLEQAQQFGSSPELLMRMLAPYLSDPRVIFAAFTFGAVIVPLIEEALKPLGVWLLAGSHLTPAEGFTAGVLCGAGYALIESLLLSSNGGTEWVSLAFARIGTGVVHILTSGLTGWGLASAWAENRYLRLGVAYLGAVMIHGLWNGLTVLMVTAGLSQVLGQTVEQPLAEAGEWAPYGLIALALLGLAALIWANWRLRGGLRAADGVV